MKGNKQSSVDTVEQLRLNQARNDHVPWKKGGLYLSERQWGMGDFVWPLALRNERDPNYT